jgi:hypothetical protein
MYVGQLRAVSCPSASACLAVGDYTDSSGQQYPIAASWSGHGWSDLNPINPATLPQYNPSTVPYLTGVSCVSATNCEVSAYSNYVPWNWLPVWAESWRGGTAWTLQFMAPPSPTIAGSGDPQAPYTYQFVGLTCSGPTACTAVGSYVSSGGNTYTYANAFG